MGRHNRSRQGGYGRNRLQKRSKSNAESYFVPSFSIRRQASEVDKLEEFLTNVKGNIGRGYEIFQPEDVSMTVIEQAKMTIQLREARERPEPEKIESLARNIASGLFRLLEDTDPGIDLPIGILSRFGSNGRRNKIGFVPRGWKGYHAKYARINEDGEKLPVGLIVDESIFAVGSIATAFSHNNRFVINGLARTPHVTFVKKIVGDITDSEFRDIAGGIMEVVEDMESQDLMFDDPVIYPKLYRRERAEPIAVR